jgi:hypothetical protein
MVDASSLVSTRVTLSRLNAEVLPEARALQSQLYRFERFGGLRSRTTVSACLRTL